MTQSSSPAPATETVIGPPAAQALPHLSIAVKVVGALVAVYVLFFLLLVWFFTGSSAMADVGIQRSLTALGVLAISLLVAILTLNWFIWRHLVGKRLQVLTEACTRLAQGDFAHRIEMAKVLGSADEFDTLASAMNATLEMIQQQHEELQDLASHDGLTGLLNRRAFSDRLTEEVSRSFRYGQSVSVLMLDLDDFKIINDRYGHLTGDRVLQDFAKTVLRPSMRVTDIVARYGGDEFVVLMPQTSPEGAIEACKRLVQRLDGFLEAELGLAVGLTVSFGHSSLPQETLTADEFVQLADRRMYEAKRQRQEVAQ